MNKRKILNDENFLCGLELPDYKLRTYLFYKGGNTVKYLVFLNGKLLFGGDDFKPSPLYNQDSLESIISLLGFLTCQPGDTDDEFFAKYTPFQMEWAKSFECEQLKGEISDYEYSDDSEESKQRQADQKAEFESYFLQP